MTAVVAGAAHGAAIVSILYLKAALLKQGLKGINFVAKTVFQSTQPEQFVVTLMRKAPYLVNRFVHILDWKVGGILTIMITVVSLLCCDKCKESYRKGSEVGARLRERVVQGLPFKRVPQ